MDRCLIAKAGWFYIGIWLVVTAAIFYCAGWFGLIPGILLLFCLFFFRNPPRKIKVDKNLVLSPADGKVMSIQEWEDEFMGGKCYKVSIFLSVFNVHVNRFPVEAELVSLDYRPGQFLPAFKSHASEINEKNVLSLKSEQHKFRVAQITGFVARRIRCYVRPGDCLKQGQRFGIILFGSCTEIMVPLECQIRIKEGDKVKGGVTIIGQFSD